MGKLRTLVLILSWMFFIQHSVVTAQPPLVAVFDYIDTYSDLAVEQMTNHRIPASVILAQAILESGSGTSALSRKSNNHFGIKCHTQWLGDTAVHTDDAANECFRKYNSIRESYIDHSNFLASRARYAHLFNLSITDYRSWCYGIKSAGYATFPGYAEELIRIIERYQLQRLDRTVLLYPVSLASRTAQLKQSPFDPASATLRQYASNAVLWLDEKEIHIRSLDLVIEAEVEEDFAVAGK